MNIYRGNRDRFDRHYLIFETGTVEAWLPISLIREVISGKRESFFNLVEEKFLLSMKRAQDKFEFNLFIPTCRKITMGEKELLEYIS